MCLHSEPSKQAAAPPPPPKAVSTVAGSAVVGGFIPPQVLTPSTPHVFSFLDFVMLGRDEGGGLRSDVCGLHPERQTLNAVHGLARLEP